MSEEALGLKDALALPAPSSASEAIPTSKRQTSPVSTDTSSIWTVSYLRNPYFTGRDGLFRLLDKHLIITDPDERPKTRRIALTQAQALTGLGGIGKTQLAVEYAYHKPRTIPTRLLPPNLALFTIFNQIVQVELITPRGATSLLDRARIYLSIHASYLLVEALCQQALNLRAKLLGARHPDTASRLHNLGYLYWQQGKTASYYHRDLAIREMQLGTRHPDTANTLNNLGKSLPGK